MITKKEFCEYIIDDFMKKSGYSILRETFVTESSSLAVAMEYLGKIKDKDRLEYAIARDGIFIITPNGKVLTTREVLELLPTEQGE